jgi:hypothetical protein
LLLASFGLTPGLRKKADDIFGVWAEKSCIFLVSPSLSHTVNTTYISKSQSISALTELGTGIITILAFTGS